MYAKPIAFIGRGLDSYKKMFPEQLNNSSLKDKVILIVPSGPSSLKREWVDKLSLHPSRITMCDSLFPRDGFASAQSRNTIRTLIDASMRHFLSPPDNIRWERLERFANKTLSDVEKENFKNSYSPLYASLRLSHDIFLSDIEKDPHWAVHCDITNLVAEFKEKKFDLILSTNLLHLYSHQLDDDFHRQAYRQMLAVLNPGGTLLVFPVETVTGQDHHLLTELITDWRNRGYVVEKNLSAAYSVAKATLKHLGGAPESSSYLKIRKSL